jgi:hypothetical protein
MGSAHTFTDQALTFAVLKQKYGSFCILMIDGGGTARISSGLVGGEQA